jgi:hypothetical protein
MFVIPMPMATSADLRMSSTDNMTVTLMERDDKAQLEAIME